MLTVYRVVGAQDAGPPSDVHVKEGRGGALREGSRVGESRPAKETAGSCLVKQHHNNKPPPWGPYSLVRTLSQITFTRGASAGQVGHRSRADPGWPITGSEATKTVDDRGAHSCAVSDCLGTPPPPSR